MADHATRPVDTTPILVMDMYEHAYQMDYGAAAAKYIDAFFVNIQWDRVAARLDGAPLPAERDERNARPTDYRPTLAFDEHPLASV